jgi:hypothetical protein
MLLQVTTIHKDEIYKHQHELPEHWSKYGIHYVLKHCWSICEAKGLNLEFLVSVMGLTCRLLNIGIYHADPVVSLVYIWCGRQASPMEFIQ